MQRIRLFFEENDISNDDVEVYIKGQINDKEYNFLLDTGAAKSTLVTDEYLESLEYSKGKKFSGVIGTLDCREVNIDKLCLGPIIENGIKIDIINNLNDNIKNVLGIDVLKKHVIVFSYSTQELLIIEEDDSIMPENLFELEVGNKYHPYIDINFKEIKSKCLWDTGASITVVDEEFVKRNPSLFERIGKDIGTDSTGESRETDIYIMKNYSINGYEFTSHKVAAIDLSNINSKANIKMDMILGFPTIRQMDWYFDFPNRKWGFI